MPNNVLENRRPRNVPLEILGWLSLALKEKIQGK